MKSKTKFMGVLGLGSWGKNVFRNFYEMGLIHTACDISPKVVSIFKNEFPGPVYTSSIKEVLLNPDIKSVSIATPASTHYEIAKNALLLGKDVFVEKPLALNSKDGQKLMEFAKKKQRILMVGHILNYHPAVIKLKSLLVSGKLGKIQYIYSNRLNIGKLRTEENILWSFAPHDISMIIMLLEEEPIKVSASGQDSFGRGVYDTTVTNLDFASGIKGHIFVSWLHPYKDQKLIVVGSKAMAVFDDISQEKLFFYPHRIEWKNGDMPIARKADYEVIPTDKGEPLRLELEHFVECVKYRRRPMTDALEGIKVLKILESAERSLADSGINNQKTNKQKGVYIHESSFIDDGVKIGEGTKIWHFSHLLKNSRVGDNCVIGQNTSIGPDVVIGNRCKIQNNVSIYKGVLLEDEVFCGPSCVFTNVYNPRASIERKDEFKPTIVKKGATIGANATIVCGVTIGPYAFVGAGAVVKNDVPAYAVVAGVPAKQIGWVCKCGVSLKNIKKNKSVCSSCGSQYKTIKKSLEPING
ncbi:MAG: Gfo/Idh/MocA family oxidoreductase [Candidatus Omnitrophota bacterium]